MLVIFWHLNSHSIQALRDTHNFVDFEMLESTLEHE
jgi:hypothetical protein